jgi:hypothetical protein
MAGWHFVSMPKKQSEEIKKGFSKNVKGWGSIRVEVKMGKTIWETSIFPDNKSGTYLLPIKAKVRKIESIFEDDEIKIEIKIV